MALVPTVPDFTAGQRLTGAMLEQLTTAIRYAQNPPEAVLTQSGAQSLANNSWVSIALDVTTVDTYGGHSNVTNNSRYTAQVAGTYKVSGAVSFAASGVGTRGVRLTKNGNPVAGAAAARTNGNNGFDSMGVEWPVVLAVGDYVEVQGFQNSGGALNTSVATDLDSALSVVWVHA